MLKNILKNNLQIFLCLIIILGVCRFIYATSFKDNNTLHKISYAEKTYHSHIIDHDSEIEFNGRKWGPLSIIFISTIKKFIPENYTSFAWRLGLFISYSFIIYFLFSLISEFKIIYNYNNNQVWSSILIACALQSSGAIYDITNGDLKIITALSIIGHFYFFCKKKYFISSIFIMIGIYYKFLPLIFAFPYLIFAVSSKNHRRYFVYLFIVGLIISIISFPIQGLIYGSLYPLSIIFSVFDQSSNSSIPIWSQEIFNPLSLINKILYGFQIEKSFSSRFDLSSTISILISLFTILLILLNGLAGLILSRFENKWQNNDQLRLIHLFFFQGIIGFLYLILSVDVSIQHLLIPLISIYAPLFLFSATIHTLNDLDIDKIKFITLYFIGLIFVGGLLPISIVNTFIPYNLIDKFFANNTSHIGEYGRFIWYHIPLIGLMIIAYVSFFYAKFYIWRRERDSNPR